MTTTPTRVPIDPFGSDIVAESARLRALGPVVPVELPGGIPAWAPTGYDALRTLILLVLDGGAQIRRALTG